MNYKPRARL